MGTFTNIEKAFEKRLKLLTESPEIAWPNTKYTPTKGVTYLRPTLLPAKGELCTLNEYAQYEGIYQIDIFVPKHVGLGEALDLADSIKTLFISNRYLTAGSDTVFVQAVPVRQGESEDAWFKIFIEINYICYS